MFTLQATVCAASKDVKPSTFSTILTEQTRKATANEVTAANIAVES